MSHQSEVFDSEDLGLDGRLMGVLLKPVPFFRKIGLGTPITRVVPYYAILALVMTLLRLHITGRLENRPEVVLLIFIAPLVGIIVNGVLAGLSQAIGAIVGAGADIPESMKVYMYGSTPLLFPLLLTVAGIAVPWVLAPGLTPTDGVEVLVSLWFVVLIVIGLREVHTISTVRALVMAAPAILLLLANLIATGAPYWWISWLYIVLVPPGAAPPPG
ncbi:MAG: YIP1 family protein [Candidatus Undinarchaeales archaeon]|jgi:hypothetical protein|nr:YIP1 family protein [Candidatus Undinarchaeales archaeon]MDP7493339.1 YIP1 family protein [Candidatus Undinarchaeales archaeon]